MYGFALFEGRNILNLFKIILKGGCFMRLELGKVFIKNVEFSDKTIISTEHSK